MAVTLYRQVGKGKARRYQKVNLGRGRRPSSVLRELIVRMARENPARCPCRTSRGRVPDEKRIAFQLESECGAFVSRAKERLRNSLNALNGVNGGIDSLCAGRWLISYLFVTANR